ncbi:hypothetical protein BCR44DRAFT_1424768 [Catenaria anguillulae PL171]|uniref:ubiquitinyl hydrolase 1 n=1 Tax=Catenaria anguillulae PL171 TaxID=765915 RepID=A0A1Y2I233_9FUNG|nr:hypothetical protein BCR44DRAFT_1424768 [Catenaria anguillulae PL171]
MFKFFGSSSSKSSTSPNPTTPSEIEGSERYFGLENVRNHCSYCNSVLQALYFCRPFREGVLNYPNLASLSDLPPSAFVDCIDGTIPTNGVTANVEDSASSISAPPTLLRRRTPSGSVKLTKEKSSTPSLPKAMLGSGTVNVTSSEEDTLIGHLRELYKSISNQKKRTGVIGPKGFINKVKKENIPRKKASAPNPQTNGVSNGTCDATSVATGSDSNSTGHSTANNKTWIHELFEGELATETRCLTCEATTQTRECFLDLSIDVEANSSIASCLWNFSQSEMMCHQDKFYCDTCSGLQELSDRAMKIKKLPPVLALHLKRFKFMEEQQKHVKLMHRVVFPTELRLFNADVEAADREYDLFAIVVHIGGTPNHGHYVALVRSADKWLLFDDDTVDLINEAHIAKYFGDPEAAGATPSASASGYILFYQARDTFTSILPIPQQEQQPKKNAMAS